MLFGGLEHLKIETRLTDERFESVMGECDVEVIGDPCIFFVYYEVIIYYEQQVK